MRPFSVVMSVYKNDRSDFVRTALDSMLLEQTVKPTEIVIVRDGKVSEELNSLLLEYEVEYSNIVKVVRLEDNGGLGNALRVGVEVSSNDIIARMDSDDICLPCRFELQLDYLDCHPEVDAVGGQMTEFMGSPDNIIGKRIVPCRNEDIYKFMKNRCAINHVTVMFRKQAVQKAGNYQDWFWNEDYYLWVRMMLANCQFANIPEIVVNVRSGVEQYARRGGRKYYESEKNIKKLQLENRMISRIEYYYYIAQRFIIQILMPNGLRGWVYRTFARQ